MHTSREWRHALTLCLVPLFAAACTSDLPANSRCRNLVYTEQGLSRSEYLPCAEEIVTALDELGQQSQAAARGDMEARSAGRATLSRVNALVNAAGGRNLLERWEDQRLTALNVTISNAVTHFRAFYMVRILEEPDQFAAQSRQAAEAELSGALKSSNEARSHYKRLE